MARAPLPWIVAATAVAAIVVVLSISPSGSSGHPSPRPDVTADKVLPPSTYSGYEQVVRAYEAARAVPQVLDGLHCYCECAKHFGHRSLLTCFESEHGAACDICIGEAILAAEMHRRGLSLEAIRKAVDARWGS